MITSTKSNVIQCSLDAIHRYEEDPRIVELGLKCTNRYLSAFRDKSHPTIRLLAATAIRSSVQSMKQFPNHFQIQQFACQILTQTSQLPKVSRTTFETAGALSVLGSSMDRCSGEPEWNSVIYNQANTALNAILMLPPTKPRMVFVSLQHEG